MTGFENTAKLTEETIDPYRAFPRSLIGGMIVAGIVYVLVSMAAALTVPVDQLAESDVALLEVVKQGYPPLLHRPHDTRSSPSSRSSPSPTRPSSPW